VKVAGPLCIGRGALGWSFALSRRFVEQTLWPHFERINAELSDHLEQVAERVIAAAMEAPVTDEDVREDAQRQLDLPEEEHG
jgi:hypothetical protein